MIIDVIDETNELNEAEVKQIQELLQCAAKLEKIEEEAEISVTIVDNARIQEINREYRNKDLPTDVISFALEEIGEGEIEINGLDMPPVLGDIIISLSKAKEQAVSYGHTFERELGFLCVHGFLHLLGYDHLNSEDEKKMFSRQEEILNEYGLTR